MVSISILLRVPYYISDGVSCAYCRKYAYGEQKLQIVERRDVGTLILFVIFCLERHSPYSNPTPLTQHKVKLTKPRKSQSTLTSDR